MRLGRNVAGDMPSLEPLIKIENLNKLLLPLWMPQSTTWRCPSRSGAASSLRLKQRLVPSDAAAVIASAISNKQDVVERAKTFAKEGKTQEALHVIDLLAMAPGEDPVFEEARTLKAELCLTRAKEVRPYVSQALYHSSAMRYKSNQISWSEE